MGFSTRLRLYTPDTVLTRFCTVSAAEVHVCPSGSWAKDFADAQTLLEPMFNGDRITSTRNTNASELDDPKLNRAIERARLVTDPRERTEAWAQVNHDVVALAPTVPYMWDYFPVVTSADVRGVQNGFTVGWDLSFTSLR